MRRILFFALMIASCDTDGNHENSSIQSQNGVDSEVNTDVVSYKLIFKEDIGWGYQIFRGTKMVINQEHVPAIQGIQGFETEADAQKVAVEVQKMVEAGNDRPTLSVQFLDSLGVI